MESASHFRFGDDWRWQARLTVPRWAEEGPGWGMACLVIDALDVAARLENGQKEASMQSCQEEEGQRQGGWSRNMGGARGGDELARTDPDWPWANPSCRKNQRVAQFLQLPFALLLDLPQQPAFSNSPEPCVTELCSVK